MNIVRQLRRQARVTQQQLAKLAGTSQSTIAAYETGTKSPTLRTLANLASALKLELDVRFVAKPDHVERRSLAYHHAISKIVQDNPNETIQLTRTQLARLRALHPHATVLINRWYEWLDLPPKVLSRLFTEHSELAQDMRQVSPFAGILSADDRKKILLRLRLENAA